MAASITVIQQQLVSSSQIDRKESVEENAAKTIAEIIANDEINDWSRESESKKVILKKSLELINAYTLSDRCDIEGLASILGIFSKNNILDYYDYAWRYQEKHEFLKDAAIAIFAAIEKKLAESNSVSLTTICNIIYNISVWDFKPSLTFIEKLLVKAQQMFKQGQSFNLQSALLLLGGACFRLGYKPNGKLEADFIISAIELTIPSMLSPNALAVENAGAVMCNSMGHALARRTRLTQFLSQMLPKEYSDYRARYGAILREFCSGNKGAKEAQELFLSLRKNRMDNLFMALEGAPKLEDSPGGKKITIDNGFQLMNERFNDNGFPYGRVILFDDKGNKVEENPYCKVIYFDFEILRKHLSFFVQGKPEQHLYKGFMWYLKKFSQNIKWYVGENLKDGFRRSVTPAFIKGFLAIIRNNACDINNDPDVIKVFSFLFKEAIAPYNLREFNDDPSTLLNILWMNMFLSNALNKSFAYTIEEQTILFIAGTKDLVMSQENARSLYQIRTMGWNGKAPFAKGLVAAMEQQFKTFSLSSNPNEEEIDWHNKILSETKSRKEDLEHDHICRMTGQEIDIAYLPLRLAIHIDGSPHFNLMTGSKTIKTIFRNRCLQEAGWTSIDVNLLLSVAQKQSILASIVKLIADAPKKALIPPKPCGANGKVIVHAYSAGAKQPISEKQKEADKKKTQYKK